MCTSELNPHIYKNQKQRILIVSSWLQFFVNSLTASWLLLLTGIMLRGGLTFYVEPFLHWDEAPQAYMAQLISRGELWPIVHFQLPYIGALEQYPLALLMCLLGDNVSTVNIYYFFLSAASLYYAHISYRRLFPLCWANFALAIFAFSHPFVLLVSMQGYSFASLIFAETFILWMVVQKKIEKWGHGRIFFVGLICGIALYNNVLAIGILLLSFLLIGYKSPFRWLFLMGFIVGYAPMLLFNFSNDFVGYQMLVAKFLGITQSMVDDSGVLGAVWQGINNKLQGHGPPSDLGLLFSFPRVFSGKSAIIQFLGLALMAIAALYGFINRLVKLKTGENTIAHWLDERLCIYACVLLLTVPGLGQTRYLTALLPFIPILIGDGIREIGQRSRQLAHLMGAVIFGYLAFAQISVFADDANDWNDEYAPVLSFLLQHNLHCGYGSYPFQSYAAFHSKGDIKISPQIGPLYLDKIPSFSGYVDRCDDVFYILPDTREYFQRLSDSNVVYQVEKVGSWNVIWNMNKRIFPEDVLPYSELARPDGYYRWSYRSNPLVLNPYRGGH